MVVYNKDGSVYKLRGPNPIAKTQAVWKKGDYKLHNLKWKSILFPDKGSNVNLFKTDFDIKGKSFAPIPIEIEEEEPIQEPVIDMEPEILEEEPISREEYNYIEQHKVVFICLPAIVKQHNDNLYNESYTMIHYGNKYTFEGIIVEETDFKIQFWAMKDIPNKSVVFPKHRANYSGYDRRWWRINEIEEKSGGFLMDAIISDYSPDLS